MIGLNDVQLIGKTATPAIAFAITAEYSPRPFKIAIIVITIVNKRKTISHSFRLTKCSYANIIPDKGVNANANTLQIAIMIYTFLSLINSPAVNPAYIFPRKKYNTENNAKKISARIK